MVSSAHPDGGQLEATVSAQLKLCSLAQEPSAEEHSKILDLFKRSLFDAIAANEEQITVLKQEIVLLRTAIKELKAVYQAECRSIDISNLQVKVQRLKSQLWCAKRSGQTFQQQIVGVKSEYELARKEGIELSRQAEVLKLKQQY